jgi:hypothetical protein
MTKRGITVARHHEIGLELARTRARLMALYGEMNTAYPRSDKLVRQMDQVIRRLDELRCTSEDVMFREHGSAASPDAYYPGPVEP